MPLPQELSDPLAHLNELSARLIEVWVNENLRPVTKSEQPRQCVTRVTDNPTGIDFDSGDDTSKTKPRVSGGRKATGL
jgi:hypothetical protein